MIEIPQPSIALNAMNPFSDKWKSEQLSAAAGEKVKYTYNTPGTRYEMWQTWDVPASVSADWVIAGTAAMATASEDGAIKCLVINCHGQYNSWGKDQSTGGFNFISTGGFGFSLGQGISYANADVFSQLRGKVTCIIIVACGAAYVTHANKSQGDGEALCSKIARAANAYVIAPRIAQAATLRNLPKNYIDNFEGEVVRFNRAGVIDDYRLLGRKLISEIF